MFPLQAQGQGHRGLGTETPGGGIQTEQWAKKLFITNIKLWPQASH